MSWARRSAQAMPAGPPPTITTSAGICGRPTPSIGFLKTSIENLFATDLRGSHGSGRFTRFDPCEPVLIRGRLASCLRFLYLFGQGRHDVEQISHDGEVCDLKDRGLRVFVHGDNRARALHADDMLNGA